MAAAATRALQYADATNQAFINRVEMSMASAAAAIASEAQGTANHSNRIILCQRFYTDPVAQARNMAVSAATQVGAGDSDAALDNAVIALWNDVAGQG